MTSAPRRRFVAGLICGIALVFAARWAINESTIPDRLVAPLLVDDSPAPAQAIVVLGGGVVGDCTPNLNSLWRLMHGAALFRAQRAPLVVLTGGTAGGHCPVAEAMAGTARDLGIPADRVIVESESRSTWQNGERTAPLLRARGIDHVVLVTDRLHMRRAVGVFARFGLRVEPVSVPIYEGHPDNVSMLYAGLREMVALVYYRLDHGAIPAVTAAAHERGGMRAAAPERPLAGSGQPDASSQAPGLVVFGASYAGSWPLDRVGAHPVWNRGVAGQRTAQFLDRFDRDVIEPRPRAVLLWGFINDLFAASDPAAAIAAIQAAYREMIDRARAGGVDPILATEITARAESGFVPSLMGLAGRLLGKTSNQDRINAQVRSVNAWLRDEGARQGLLVLDFERTLAGADGERRPDYTEPDGSHVTTAGYAALTAYAAPRLLDRLARQIVPAASPPDDGVPPRA